MSNNNKIIDDYLKKEKNKKIRSYLILSILSALTFIAYEAYLSGETSTIQGTVTSLYSEASEHQGEHFYIFAKLYNGRIVKLRIARQINVKKGNTININRRETGLFGFKSHTFNSIQR